MGSSRSFCVEACPAHTLCFPPMASTGLSKCFGFTKCAWGVQAFVKEQEWKIEKKRCGVVQEHKTVFRRIPRFAIQMKKER